MNKTLTGIIAAGILAIGCGDKPTEPTSQEVTVDTFQSLYVDQQSRPHFWGEVFNFGDETLEGLKPFVTYTDSSGTYTAGGDLFLKNSSQFGPYFPMSALLPGRLGYWKVEPSKPLVTGLEEDWTVDWYLPDGN